jgi:hypothetical protein
VTTTLDWGMQKIAEKYTYVAARAPHSSNPRKVLARQQDPGAGVGLDPQPARSQHP